MGRAVSRPTSHRITPRVRWRWRWVGAVVLAVLLVGMAWLGLHHAQQPPTEPAFVPIPPVVTPMTATAKPSTIAPTSGKARPTLLPTR
jgi:hypothetical protein